MKYKESQPLLKAAIEGYVAACRQQFPPENPYARFGVIPGEEEENPLGAAWYFGYWEKTYGRTELAAADFSKTKREKV